VDNDNQCCGSQGVYTLIEPISTRSQEGFHEKSSTSLHCLSLLCNVPNLLHLECDDELQPTVITVLFNRLQH